ncbi:hypothetical protein [Abyssalbus ytuae]|uniref:Uncharacterized protein n=1 Tax=Abyssalbus ytuae TaxID=2926907 RepID=A0A9E6ZTZ2_9FLAO|nr:hypothetical protein [Abyssalbus ytuae]UOB16666.1 hypothetical protein MQE35_13080 [Abyssalbus ytuae]
MKHKNLVIILIIIIMPVTGYSQLSMLGHNEVINIDTQTMIKLGILNGTLSSRNSINTGMNILLKTLIIQQKQLLKSKYDKSPHDHSSSFVAASAASIALSMGEHILASEFSKGYYMTKNKRKYIDHMTLDKALLPFLQVLDHKNITAANRQEIYRLRSEIIRQYSQNDKQIRNMMLLPAAAYAIENKGDLLKLIKKLEIAL